MTGVAFGFADPAANNAAVELTPESPAAIAGLSAMFRHLGIAFGSATIVVFAERAPTLEAGMARAFELLGLVCVLNMRFALGIPDKVGSGWARAPGATRPPSGAPSAVAREGD